MGNENLEVHFLAIHSIIQSAKRKAFQLVNMELIHLYWQVGKYVSGKLEIAKRGENIVEKLAIFLKTQSIDLVGFDKRSIYRMVRLYETYCNIPFSESPTDELVTTPSPQIQKLEKEDDVILFLSKISWSHHLEILSGCKTLEEKIFYILLTINEKYTVAELRRQIKASYYERTLIGEMKMPSSLKTLPQEVTNVFKDTYIFEFLGLPEIHSEMDLQKALVKNLKKFILELGKDFVFIEEEYRLQVGTDDFFIDLLLFHRDLRCLVAIELKTTKFMPEHLGQLNFYLEALDRDVKKAHENPSIGILLCKTKNDEIVQYALSRSMSPTLVAEYESKLIDKYILQQKLHELFELYEK